jgi:hypothetical protein
MVILVIEHRFFHEVLTPFIRFRARSAENICVQAQSNDVIVLAQEAATAAYHFPEAVRGKPTQMNNPVGEAFRQKLGDVVDSRKHGKLGNPDRQISLNAALAYEVNDADEFRYLGTQIWAVNKRFGQFELGHLVELFIEEIRREFSIKIDLKLELPSYQFSKKIITYFTDKTVYAENVQFYFYKRADDGALSPVNPKIVDFEIRELDQSKPPHAGGVIAF